MLLSLALVAATALPVSAWSGLAFLPQTAGQRVTYRIVRNVQTTTGALTTSSTFAIVRRAGTTLVVERSGPSGAPNLSLLRTNPDGSLALADARSASDGELNDLLFGLNLALDATREADPSAGGTWLAVVPIAPSRGAPTASVVLVPGANGKTGFDFSGSTDTTANAGIPGVSRRNRGDETDAPSRLIALTIRIDGHAAKGAVNWVTITQTRTLTVAAMPFVNVGSWTITVGP